LFFARERAEAEKKARTFAVEIVSKRNLPVPDKNARSSDPVRIAYDAAFTAAYSEEFERSFTPINYFFSLVRRFYSTAVAELIKRFNFDDDVFNILPMVKPKNARNLNPESLSSLFQRFPVLNEKVDRDEAENEWRDHINLLDEYFKVSSEDSELQYLNMDVEFYWNRVFAAKCPSGNPKFPNLKVCISLLLSLPFSNVRAECCFSDMNNTKTLNRNRLHDKTVDGLMKGDRWLKSQNKTAGTVNIPDDLLKMIKNVKSNTAIVSSDESEIE
jgi:hypothetical protein